MSARANACAAATLLLSGSALAVPALGLAASGGTGLAAPGATAPTTHGTAASSPGVVGVLESGNVTVSAGGNGITVATRASAILHGTMRFTGTVPATAAGSTVEIERLGHETQWQWTPTAYSTAGPGGAFTVAWHTNHIGRFQFRALLDQNGRADAASASTPLTATVYLPAIATWYGGPSVNGSRTACGEVLHPNTLGVAHRTLKCGMLVALYYQGRTVTVPVIDRGPYANGANWDLTEATAKALGMYGAGIATIAAASLPPPP